MLTDCPSISCRELNEGQARELYFTAAPEWNKPIYDQALELYQTLSETMRYSGMRIFAERIFATEEAMTAVEAGRKEALGDLDDGISPTRIHTELGQTGPFAGVQIHAISSEAAIQPLQFEDAANGRELTLGDDRWLMLSELIPDASVTPRMQTAEVFERVGRFLKQADADMHAVARTWLWLKDVCDWYDDLNDVRTTFFKKEGLIQPGVSPRLPASTGIGLGGMDGAALVLDLIAMPGQENKIQLLEAGGDQKSAFEYGSAFSRAAVVPMPGGQTLFVSGTAAIDVQGHTEHIGEIQSQIRDTIQHVRALLVQASCTDEHVLSALIYCKTPAVEQSFLADWADLGWPALTLIGDVCRPELLFEIELVAGPALGYNGLKE